MTRRMVPGMEEGAGGAPTVYGDPGMPYGESITVDETTGELVLVYAPTLAELDELCETALEAA